MTTVRVRASRRQAAKRAAPARRVETRHVNGARRPAKRRREFAPARSRGRDARLAGARRPVAAAAPGRAPVAAPTRPRLGAGFRVVGFLGAFTLTMGGLSIGGADRTAIDDLPAPQPAMTAEAAPAVAVETPAAAAPERTFSSPPGLRADTRSAIEQAADA
ncbi:MAG TPA: hypothetical protein VET85_02690, partial [Stellaceae bacterium]|nr:hypothetical protein [Stellaceae bacterium]